MISVVKTIGRYVLASGLALALAFLASLGGAQAKSGFVLYSFCAKPSCGDGANPFAGLIADSQGNFYGTTNGGGTYGFGTVFKLPPGGKAKVLYSFQSGSDGASPLAGLIADDQGNLYGTTSQGGKNGDGTVFKLTPRGRETVLYSFCALPSCGDGYAPNAGLIADAQGNLYGTTLKGGQYSEDHGGTVFKLTPHGIETVLYSFCLETNCTDGSSPYASLLADDQGNLYGTTEVGGKYNDGTVFKLTPDGTETVLHSFCSKPSCADGKYPYAALIADSEGNLYGTTNGGGGTATCGAGCGTAFKLAPDGKETVLHAFCSKPNCVDGYFPYAGLIADSLGNFYGTTEDGGKYGTGAVFQLAPNGRETVLHSFCSKPSCSDGFLPYAGLIADGLGNLYGTTYEGGKYSNGTVFEIAE